MKGRTPTAEEKRWMNAICKHGCIVCWNTKGIWSPASPHHIDGKTKPDTHFKTIPLCGPHHQIKGEGWETRHYNKTAFEKAYGTEYELLEQMQGIIGR